MPLVPPPPPQLFAAGRQEHYSEILEDQKTIRATSFISLKVDDWESVGDVLAMFLNFAEWGTYATRSGAGVISFESSVCVSDIDADGIRILQHYAHYHVKGPLGIWIEFVQLNYNRLVLSAQGAAAKVDFSLAPTSIPTVPEIGAYQPKGLRDLRGVCHIAKRSAEQDYLVTICVDVLPELDFAAHLAQSYVVAVGRAMVTGMFDVWARPRRRSASTG